MRRTNDLTIGQSADSVLYGSCAGCSIVTAMLCPQPARPLFERLTFTPKIDKARLLDLDKGKKGARSAMIMCHAGKWWRSCSSRSLQWRPPILDRPSCHCDKLCLYSISAMPKFDADLVCHGQPSTCAENQHNTRL